MRLGKGSLPRENKRVSKARAGVGNSTLWGSGSLAARRIGRKPEGGTFGIKSGDSLQEDLCPKTGTREHLNQKGTEQWRSAKTLKECCHCPWCVWTKARLELTEEWA